MNKLVTGKNIYTICNKIIPAAYINRGIAANKTINQDMKTTPYQKFLLLTMLLLLISIFVFSGWHAGSHSPAVTDQAVAVQPAPATLIIR